ncbi:MAG: DUF1489 family protein [Rhodospirillaceae bacterium]
MALNIIKLAVGIDDVDHLKERQKHRRNENGNCFHRTRMMPARAKEIVGLGSMYWVIKGIIQVRQPIVGLNAVKGDDGRAMCEIELDPKLVLVQATACRAFQGWRYLKPESAPADMAALRGKVYVDPKMPKALRLELSKLGLL